MKLRKILAILLSVLLFAACLPLGALPAISVSAATSGTTGDCTWTLDDDGHLTIFGNGKMGDYDWCNAPWGTDIVSVTIEDGITTIEDTAFYKCVSLISVTIPDSVTTIGQYAFAYCDSLTSVTIPNSVTTIDWYAFYDCTSLTSVTIPDSVTFIGSNAFSSCDSLTSVTIPNSVTTIGERAFSSCDSLASASIGDSVTFIWKSTFSDCPSLTAIEVDVNNTTYCDIDGVLLSKDATTLILCPEGRGGDYTIPNSVTSINDEAFSGCTSLTSVTIPDSVTSIGYGAFTGCSLISVTIPNSVTFIANHMFEYCTALQSVTIPDSVTSIGWGAFRCCRSLTSVTIPDSVTLINDEAFDLCTSLTSVTIPDSVTTIGDEAFDVCISLTDVYYGGNEEQKVAISIGNDNDPLLNATWHYNAAPICDHIYDNDADPDCNACGALRWAVCPDTDVTVRNEDGSVLPADTTITVDTVKTDDVDVTLDGNTALVEVYDISMLLNGQEIQPAGVVAVTLPAPQDAARYTDLLVVYIDDAGNVTPCQTVVNEDGTITFYTDHFSYYAIVGTPTSAPGDADGNGKVTNRDLAKIQQYITGWIDEEELDIVAADVDGNGKINNRDLAKIQQYITGWITEL